MDRLCRCGRFIPDLHTPRLAVELKGYLATTVLIGFRAVDKTNRDGLAALQFDQDFISLPHSIEKSRGRQIIDIPEFLPVFVEITKYVGVHLVTQKIENILPVIKFLLERCEFHIEIHRWQAGARRAGQGLFAFQYHCAQFRRKTTLGLAELAAEQVDYGIGKGQHGPLCHHVFLIQPVGGHEQGHVAYHFGGRRYFHNITEHSVDDGIVLFDLLEPVFQTQRDSLRTQIGILPPGNFVVVYFGGSGLQPRFKRIVALTHRFPVVGIVIQRFQVKSLFAFLTTHHSYQGIHIHLRSQSRHGTQAYVHDIHIVLDSLEQGRSLHR